jgi:hypothetical protein
MELSFVPPMDASSAARTLPPSAGVTGAWDFTSIPDPVRLRSEGITLRCENDVADTVLLDWCKRANECLRFLTATAPSRIWIWQEQCFRSCWHSRRS